jgi:hypothetical protein
MLRARGFTYAEIQSKLHRRIPKGTLSSWFREVALPSFYADKMRRLNLDALARGRRKAAAVKQQRRRLYLESVYGRNEYLLKVLRQKDVSKLFLAALYLGEGAKKNRGSLTFANSDPGIIDLFLRLLRAVYKVDETKFRCTVLCRADQDPRQLCVFWSRKSGIPLKQFYEARIDPRTRGKVTQNKHYKGVCRIDFFSSKVYDELKIIGNLTIQGP